jgi:hypothetical protein
MTCALFLLKKLEIIASELFWEKLLMYHILQDIRQELPWRIKASKIQTFKVIVSIVLYGTLHAWVFDRPITAVDYKIG